MTRYIVLPTVLVFALGLGAGWALRGGRSKPRDVWDDAAWWSKGFEDGLKIRHLTRDTEWTGEPERRAKKLLRELEAAKELDAAKKAG